MRIELPYGKGKLACTFPAHTALLAPRTAEAAREDGESLVRRAMEAPIGAGPLEALARNKPDACVILSDHTRPVPSRDILPPMLEALRRGNPEIEITLLVATGCHRPSTEEELRAKLGRALYENERIAVHDCRDAGAHVRLGTLPSGAPLFVNRVAAGASLLLSEGFIEPHFFAGFSGGRKAVLPGVCSLESVLCNHAGDLIGHEKARTGLLDGNPIHADMIAAARMAKLAYIVNVVIDENKRTLAAFAGDPEKAHEAGCAFLRERCALEAAPADVVFTTNGGAPLDQNVYQCIKGLTAAEASAKEGAVLIIAAECRDGSGGEGFFSMLRDCESPRALFRAALQRPRERTLPDQWEAQIAARILMRHAVIFVSGEENRAMLEAMGFIYAPTPEAALALAMEKKGPAASVTVIPDGVGVIIRA